MTVEQGSTLSGKKLDSGVQVNTKELGRKERKRLAVADREIAYMAFGGKLGNVVDYGQMATVLYAEAGVLRAISPRSTGGLEWMEDAAKLDTPNHRRRAAIFFNEKAKECGEIASKTKDLGQEREFLRRRTACVSAKDKILREHLDPRRRLSNRRFPSPRKAG